MPTPKYPKSLNFCVGKQHANTYDADCHEQNRDPPKLAWRLTRPVEHTLIYPLFHGLWNNVPRRSTASGNARASANYLKFFKK